MQEQLRAELERLARVGWLKGRPDEFPSLFLSMRLEDRASSPEAMVLLRVALAGFISDAGARSGAATQRLLEAARDPNLKKKLQAKGGAAERYFAAGSDLLLISDATKGAKPWSDYVMSLAANRLGIGLSAMRPKGSRGRIWSVLDFLSSELSMATSGAPPEDSGPSEPETLRFARDIEIRFRLDPSTGLRAELRGLVTGVNPRGGVVFLRLRDATGSVQLVAEKKSLTRVWDRVRKIRPKDLVQVEGRVEKTKANVLSVSIDDLRLVPSSGVRPERQMQDADRDALSMQFFLARLREQAVSYLETAGFVEFEPKYIALPSDEPGIEALRVVFPGFGASASLAPSPGPQLLGAILVTGSPKVFCVSRCFSAEVRDGYTSAESLIVCARELEASLQDMCALAEGAMRHAFSDYTTMPSPVDPSWLGEQEWPTRHISSFVPAAAVEAPEIQTAESPPIRGSPSIRAASAFRICWPPDVIAAEGHVELVDEAFRVGGVTLHLERMATLLGGIAPLRLRKEAAQNE